MKKGDNCKKDYNPYRTKYCSKCNSKNHHEFDCSLYLRYNPSRCSTCDKGHHFPAECKETPRFPPHTSNLNCIEHTKN
jgi:hypothetical protein